MMIYFRRNEDNPWFNLAAEEYVLKHINEDVIMLWQSSAVVVVGKHQNTVAEVNLPFVNEHNIPVIRRISGGGTVFHGQGNLNYTQITTGKNQSGLIDFKKFTQPVIKFLNRQGVAATFEGKNNLMAEGKKFSGNSAHIFKNRIIHHGTLLFDADLDLLDKVIHPGQATVEDKSITSIRASVVNLKPYLPGFSDFESFKRSFEEFLMVYFSIGKSRVFTQKEKNKIETLVSDKYQTLQWNFGYSPNYRFNKEIKTPFGKMEVEMQVRKGIISDIRLFYEGKQLVKIEEQLEGFWHEPDTLRNKLSANRFTKTIMEVLF